MFDSLATGTSSGTFLEQVRLSEVTDEQRPIADMIIGNIDKLRLSQGHPRGAFPRHSIEKIPMF
jgi:hypothetical protein